MIFRRTKSYTFQCVVWALVGSPPFDTPTHIGFFRVGVGLHSPLRGVSMGQMTADRATYRSECAVLCGEDRERVVATIKPHLCNPLKLDEAMLTIERALDTALWGGEQGHNRKPQRPAPSVRKELEKLGELGGFPASLSPDAERLLDVTDLPAEDMKRLFYMRDLLTGGPVDGADQLAKMEAHILGEVRRAIARFDEKSQTKIPPGSARRWDLRLAGEELADVWEKYTGRTLSRQNRSPCAEPLDGGPFPTFLGAVLQTIEPGFSGVKLAREIHEKRQRRAAVDRSA